MNTDKLIEKLSKKGTVHVCKKGFVFTLFMTGKGLSDMKKLGDISKQVLDEFGGAYPIIEVMQNEDDFILMILRPRSMA
jgi:hypothetical protein